MTSQRGISASQAAQADENFEELEVAAVPIVPISNDNIESPNNKNVRKRPAAARNPQQSLLTQIGRAQTKALMLQQEMKTSKAKKYLGQQLNDIAMGLKEVDSIKKEVIAAGEQGYIPGAHKWLKKMNEVVKSTKPILKSYGK